MWVGVGVWMGFGMKYWVWIGYVLVGCPIRGGMSLKQAGCDRNLNPSGAVLVLLKAGH